VGPNYSAINLYPESAANGLHGNQASGILPLRLIQVRSAIFYVFPRVGPQASIRTATGTLNGAQQNCVLIVAGAGKRVFTGGRNWEESKYCVDAQRGPLNQYSPSPGLFVRYDYSSGIRFHDKFIPTVHGNLAGDGALSEVEILASSNPALNQAAVTQAKSIGLRRARNQPGATSQSSELILTFEFITSAH